jgi:hypothetical protein
VSKDVRTISEMIAALPPYPPDVDGDLGSENSMLEVSSLREQRDVLAARNAVLIELAEFWINREEARCKSDAEYQVCLTFGHQSHALRNARAALAACEVK